MNLLSVDHHFQKALGLFFLRGVLGLIFLMQGYGKVFKIGIEKLYQGFFQDYTQLLPDFLVRFTAYYTSYAELLGGVLVILGLFRLFAYLGLATVLMVVSFGHGLVEPIWNLDHVFYRTAILAVLFLIPLKYDRFSLDHLFAKSFSLT